MTAFRQLNDHLKIEGFRDRMKNTNNPFLIDALVVIVADQEERIKRFERRNNDQTISDTETLDWILELMETRPTHIGNPAGDHSISDALTRYMIDLIKDRRLGK